MTPGLLKVTVADQDPLLTSPSPPAPSHPFAQRKLVTDPGLDTTLWMPPPLRKVTVSPATIVRLAGLKVMFALATTSWFAASDRAGHNPTTASVHGPGRRVLSFARMV